MRKLSKTNLTILIILLSVALITGLKYFLGSQAGSGPIDPSTARSKGSPQAPLQILEFIDLQCPACAKGHMVLSNYIDYYPGQIYVKLKYFPFASHQHSIRATRYAECAARQEKFWPFVDVLLQEQPRWAGLINAEPAFAQFAQSAALDPQKLNACLSDESIDKIIAESKSEGTSRGVQSTPTYFINNEMIVGWRTLDQYLTSYFARQTSVQIMSTEQ